MEANAEVGPRRSLASRLLVLLGAGAFLVLLTLALLLLRLRSIHREQLRVHDELGARSRSARTIQVEFKKQVQEWKDVLLRGHDPAGYDRHFTAFEKQERLVREGVDALAHAPLDPDSRRLLEDFKAAHSILGSAYREAAETFRRTLDPRKADSLVQGGDRPPTLRLDEMVLHLQAQTLREQARLDAAAVGSIAWSLAAAAAAGVVLLALGVLLTRRLTRPIAELAAFARNVGRTRDYRLRAGIRADDEVGALAEDFNAMLAEVQTRDADLERRVAERTRDLADLEARTRAILEGAAEGIVGLDGHGVLEWANPAAARMFGSPLADMIGRPLGDFVPLPWTASSGAPAPPAEGIGRRPDGSRFPVEVLVREVQRDGRRVYSGILRDLSARKEAEEAVRKAEDKVRHSQKMEAVGRLAGGVAHDFNNLLTVILGYTGLLTRSLGETDANRASVEQIQRAAQAAADLTRQLLAFSRRQVLAPRVLDLNVSLRDMDRLLRRVIGEDVDLVSLPSPGLHHVLVDPGQLQQVLMNLAINARHAMPGGGKLTIETANATLDETYARMHPDVEPGDYVMIAVSDTGTGMSAETQAHLFEPFFTTKPAEQGTGLGLSTAYGIIRQSGGHIWVYSEPGQGSTFKIFLPRVSDPVSPAPAPPPPLTVAKPGETVLVVEDEAGIRTVIRAVLSEAGYRILESGRPEEALRIAAEHPGPIDLLLTDVVMPGLGGRELANRLAKDRPATKVLFMSGYTQNGIVHHGRLDPGTAYLAKPFTPLVLAAKIREVLDAPA